MRRRESTLASLQPSHLNTSSLAFQERLGDHFDTTTSHWKAIVEALAPEVARDIYETKVATKRNRNTQVVPSDVPVVQEEQESSLPPQVLWPLKEVRAHLLSFSAA